ncbi:hypothetical protein DFP72DRAFT_854799 [Ephemerocybe angulata]|uniref:Uncharacterized protein n=1 Tax=Ephemerocybe angulata TaxID=980116 RepID=A0A8H6HH52_9AGAR|nr:hypothetical protein DFP72DRAFT_854799 [Tulosesus angulatus]
MRLLRHPLLLTVSTAWLCVRLETEGVQPQKRNTFPSHQGSRSVSSEIESKKRNNFIKQGGYVAIDGRLDGLNAKQDRDIVLELHVEAFPYQQPIAIPEYSPRYLEQSEEK